MRVLRCVFICMYGAGRLGWAGRGFTWESGTTELRRFCAEFIHPPCEQYKRSGVTFLLPSGSGVTCHHHVALRHFNAHCDWLEPTLPGPGRATVRVA